MNEMEPRPPPLPPRREIRQAVKSDRLDIKKNYQQQPYYLQWTKSLSHLFEDRDGVELLKIFVEQKSSMYKNHLNFYFACEGLKEHNNQEKINQIIGAIYRSFIRKKPSLLSITPELDRTINAGLKNGIGLNQYIFDPLQENVQKIIQEKIYPDFLRSDVYRNYVKKISASRQQDRYGVVQSNSTRVLSNITKNSSIPTLPNRSSKNIIGAIPKMYTPSQMPTPSLHENYVISDNSKCQTESNQSSLVMPSRLTNDSLRATQITKLNISHQTYPDTTSSISKNPNSSIDSVTIPMLNYPLIQNPITNKEINSFSVIPQTQHSIEYQKSKDFSGILVTKLEKLKSDQDMGLRLWHELDEDPKFDSGSSSPGSVSISIQSTTTRDSDQDILDQHVSRVWEDLLPVKNPSSPSSYLISKRQTTTTTTHEFNNSNRVEQQKSNPSSVRSFPLTNKWLSTTTDSGISMFSADYPKYTDLFCHPERSNTNSNFQLELEAKRRLEDQNRRSRQKSHHNMPPPITKICQSGSNTQQSTTSSYTKTIPDTTTTTTVVFTFCDEKLPYRKKVTCLQPTLKHFKDALPKKGNFRYFFRTHCDDPENPVIQEEIVNDSDILPLFESKVMGSVKQFD